MRPENIKNREIWSEMGYMIILIKTSENAARRLSIFGVFLVRILQHSDRIQRDTENLSVFSLNAGKYGPKEIQIRTLFTQ